jgi:sarcosine oxidase
MLSSAEIRKRFPGLRPEPAMAGVLEPRAGILFPEKCIAAHLNLARRAGALLRTNEPILEWTTDRRGVTIRTGNGRYRAPRLVLSCGPWLPGLLEKSAPEKAAERLDFGWQIERQVLLWFKALRSELFERHSFPIHLWEYEPEKMFYGFPDLGTGVKFAFHHQGEMTSPETVRREIKPDDITKMRALLGRFVPDANGEFLRGTVCLYTNTADGHFILDHGPEDEHVILASPCSGHGFKFTSALGELLADLAQDRAPRVNPKLFRCGRFRKMEPRMRH